MAKKERTYYTNAMQAYEALRMLANNYDCDYYTKNGEFILFIENRMYKINKVKEGYYIAVYEEQSK